MDGTKYVRPREKLQINGVRSLQLDELLQLVIGSGTNKISAAKLARTLLPNLYNYELTLNEVQQQHGMGIAKSCQFLAVQELIRRNKP